MDLVERLIFIVTTIQRRDGVTARELAELCGTSERNIYRDIRRLDEAGIQIRSKGRQGYFLVEPLMPKPSRLSQEEYLALALSPLLVTSTKLKEYPFHHSFRRAMEKILSRFQVNDDWMKLGERIRIHAEASIPEQEEIMEKIIEGILRNETLDCFYHAMYRDELTRRLIDPYYLVPRSGHLYLIGFCHLRGKVLTFRISRFQKITFTNQRFSMVNGFQIDQYLANLWGITAGEEEVTFQVRFSAKVARYVKEERYAAHCQWADQADGSLILWVVTRGPEEFLRWMKQFGKEAELLAPAEYRRRMLAEIEEMREMYRREP